MFNAIRRLINKTKHYIRRQQLALLVLVCLPCVLITTWALTFAGVSVYLIAFISIILILLCVFVVVANKQNADFQVRTLSNLIESMIDGDYSLRGKLDSNLAFKELLYLINNLADTLAKHKAEARESKMLLERIMEQMNAMVLATDANKVVVMANVSAQKCLSANGQTIVGQQLSALAEGNTIDDSSGGIIEFKQGTIDGEYFLFKETFLSEGQPHHLYLLTNAERLLMEKERQAWQSLLRVLSHEMNNSLAPISSISQSLTKKLNQQSDDLLPGLKDGISIINERSNALTGFIATYSQLSHLPRPKLSNVELMDLLETLVKLMPELEFTINDNCNRLISVDKQQLEQILINLFKNAGEAMGNKAQKAINVYCQEDYNQWHLKVEDFGTGIANTNNLFVPFYTTKKQGSGIGLALSRQIMFNHLGSIELTNKADKSGCIATLSFPK